MKLATIEWQQHVTQNVTQICNCLKIYNDQTSLHLTDHDRHVKFFGRTYLSDDYLEVSAVKYRQNLQDDGFELTTNIRDHLISNGLLDDDFLNAAKYELYQVNWGEPSVNNLLKMGYVGDVQIDDYKLKFNLHGMAKPLENTHGRLLQEKCDAQFGDERCGVNSDLAAYNKLGQVSAIISAYQIEVTLPAGIDGEIFSHGKINWLSGANAVDGHDELRVISHRKKMATTHIITLASPVKNELIVGDNLKLQIGCNKSFATCDEVFFNATQFRGFAQMPGKGFKFAYPQRSLFDV